MIDTIDIVYYFKDIDNYNHCYAVIDKIAKQISDNNKGLYPQKDKSDKNWECQKFCVSPITNRATTASAIALTQKNLHNRYLFDFTKESLNYISLFIHFSVK